MSRIANPRTAGFTLVELLVAIAIFAVIGVLATAGFRSVENLRAKDSATMERLREVQLAISVMTRDFTQLEPRPVRDGLGGVQAALMAGPENVPPIAFTRGGWANPLGSVRSTQQRVAYALEDGKLVRAWWPELDGSVQSDPEKQELLSDVDSVKVQYYDPAAGAFADQWPPLVNGQSIIPGQAPNPNQLPSAVSITLTLKDWGTVTRIVEVATR
ncbi:MAG: type II secretion system minor pseudopilin GspJ [Bacillota bacterium]